MERATDFSGPKSLCRWAKGDIANFEAAEKAFFDENPGVDFQELDYRTNIMTFGIRAFFGLTESNRDSRIS